jgi:NADH-quinone oxidoreductase subunit G
MSDTVTLTIDGKDVTVPKGTNVLEAARQLGNEISHFCYHPGLSIAASCRQCLVEIAGQGKLQPSCQVVATDGMKVSTNNDRVLWARRQMLEFTLVNHPVDCPICDKAGECLLQRHYFDWDNKESRVDMDKVHKPKKKDLGPTIVLDAERCILCSRCIRTCDEVAGVHQLEFIHRGDHEELTCAPGQVLDNPYSLNTVDVCPVGALTSKDFRFAMRAWELYTTPSVCNGCATGCNVEVHHNAGRIYRLVPRVNLEVNKYWMCDEGRVTYKAVHEARLAVPTVDGLPSSLEKAVSAAAAKLQSVLDADRGAVGVVFSANASNEDNFVLGRLAGEFLGLSRAYIAGRAPVPERADEILRDADVNANTAGARAIAAKFFSAGQGDLVALASDLAAGKLRGLIVLGADTTLPEAALAAAAKLEALVVVTTHTSTLEQKAHAALAAADWPEVNATITNRDGRVQRLRQAFEPAGKAQAGWELLARLARKLGATLEYPYPRAIFNEMTQQVPAFAGAAGSWGKEAQLVQLRFANSRG